MADRVQQICSFLKSQSLHYSEKWVIEAVEYYRSNDPNISLQSLKNEIYNQWKLNNLRDFKIPSLPSNLPSHEKITLPGKYAVQVEQMLDASQSCYSQLQKLQKVSLDNIEATETPGEWHVKIKPNRCLTFTISDGVQEVRAMEYAPIKKLREDDPELLPGFKMIIIGPVQCRKGMILLKEENVEVLGGEVDAFSEIYKKQSILCKRLNIEDSIDEQSEENFNQNDNVSNENIDISNLLSENDEVFMNVSLDEDFDEAINPQNQNQLSNQSNFQNPTVQSNPSDYQHSTIQSKPTLQSSNQSIYQKSTGQSNNLLNYQNLTLLSNKPKETISTENLNKEKTKQTTLTSFLSQSAKKVEEIKQEFPVTVDIKPFVYLKQIMESDFKKPAIFTIKATILTMKKKLTVKNNAFAMSAIITDGSYALEAEFSPETIEDVMGYSTDEIKEMSRQKAHNSAMADRLKTIFKNAQQKLIELCCLMELKFLIDEDLPCVISLEQVTLEHLNELRARKLQV